MHRGTATRGVVPFENSTNGSVVFTLDLLADLRGRYPDILVEGETYVRVRHCLLGHRPPAAAAGPKEPGVDYSRIRTLYSHPQAWGQCNEFLNAHLKHVERQDVSSTSRAAEIVGRDRSGAVAAISSGIAAEVYGAEVLAEGIESRGDNETRFFVIRKGGPGAGADGEEQDDGGDGGDALDTHKSLVTFTVDHDDPGALAQSLSVFSRFGLNLTSINTRPSGVEKWNYVFFVEVKGRRRRVKGGDDQDGGKVNGALKALSGVCREWRFLGSWEIRAGT